MNLVEKHRNTLIDLARRIDGPFFFYDLDAMAAHLRKLTSLSPENIQFWFATKANPLSAILKIVRNEGWGIDIASLGELDQALRVGVPGERLIATGPAKNYEYLKGLAKGGVDTVVCESISQLEGLIRLKKELGHTPKILLRVQLRWNGGKSVLGGDEITPFGVEASTWATYFSKHQVDLPIVGLHAFQWGNILEVSELKRIWTETAAQLSSLADQLKIPRDILDLGGGLGISYDSTEGTGPRPEDIFPVIKEIKKKFEWDKIWLELGRYAVGPFGLYLSPVVDRKKVSEKELLVLEGGINHIARPALTNQAFPGKLLRESNNTLSDFQVHGPLCTALDQLGTHALPNDISIGDWMAFSQCGAYGMTEAMPYFLCHDLPAEAHIYKNDIVIPRPRKTSSDWMR